MIINKQIWKQAWVLGLVVALAMSCDEESQQRSDIPFVDFPNIEINLRNQSARPLQSQGYIKVAGGAKGIIVHYDRFNDRYVAFERNCSYQPFDACALVDVDASGLFMIGTCCSSQFSLPEGNPTKPPATFPLRQYRTFLDGNFLVITSEPVN